MLNKTIQRAKEIPILSNGHRKYYGKQSSVLTYNTCAFDTIFQIFAAIFIDYEHIQNRFEENEEAEFYSMIAATFNYEKKGSGLMTDLYERRFGILKRVYAEKIISTTSGLLTIDCNSNIAYTIEHAMPQSFFSYSRVKHCNSCSNSVLSRRVFIDINLELFASETVSIQDLNEHINIDLLCEVKKSKCTTNLCSGMIEIDTTFSEVVVIDLQLIDEKLNKIFSINEVPQELDLRGIKYKIFAMAEYIKKSGETIGHYIAHVRRFNNQWETYNDLLKVTEIPSCNRRAEIHTLFYIQQNLQ